MNNVFLVRVLIGLTGAALIAVAARRLRMLTFDGALAAVIIGAAVFGFGGWRVAALLLIFFLSSSLLTRLEAARKFHPEHMHGRSMDQVLANGVVATLLAIWHGLSPTPVTAAGFAGAIAAATADAWATEIGLLSPNPPRLITTWKVVPQGQSGAISPIGTAAGVGGALLIAAAGWWWMHTPVGMIWSAGVAGMLIDSLLGATLEERIKWFNNNLVNVSATTAGALIAILTS